MSTTEQQPSSAPNKPRSCVVCRTRKVKCDKLLPCTNCKRARIACVVPQDDRPPKWARRLDIERLTAQAAGSDAGTSGGSGSTAASGSDARVRELEDLVAVLRRQLDETANATSTTASSINSLATSTVTQPRNRPLPGRNNGKSDGVRRQAPPTASVQKQLGGLVLQDQEQQRYVGSGFWSHVNNDITHLEIQPEADSDSEPSDGEPSSQSTPLTKDTESKTSDRYTFLTGQRLSAKTTDRLDDFRPLPSLVPFLLDTFADNINIIFQMVDMPTVISLSRNMRRRVDSTPVSPSDEALLFSIYYSAVASMEDHDVLDNFNVPKADLARRFRHGYEIALVQADFMSKPDLALVQSLVIFLHLVRLEEDPRFIWMMTGVTIRMAQGIGLHRDGINFPNLSPFEVQTRRRVWWMLCHLEIRSAESQGTEIMIPSQSFDTQFPLNIGSDALRPATKEWPPVSEGLTDMSVPVTLCKSIDTIMRMMVPGRTVDEKGEMLSSLYENVEKGYLRYVTPGEVSHWVYSVSTRLVISKLTLLIYLPSVLSAGGGTASMSSSPVRDKLLIAAIEVAEYNHALNSEVRATSWRWVYQVYVHWYAIVLLLLEVSRREWSATVERAWIALQSVWLIPKVNKADRTAQVWVPLKNLMRKAKSHRVEELRRLRGDKDSVETVARQDEEMLVPNSSGPFGEGVEPFRRHWRELVNMPSRTLELQSPSRPAPNVVSHVPPEVTVPPVTTEYQVDDELALLNYDSPLNTLPEHWAGAQIQGASPPWLLADSMTDEDMMGAFSDVDMSMDLTGGVDWNTWLEEAAGMEVSSDWVIQ